MPAHALLFLDHEFLDARRLCRGKLNQFARFQRRFSIAFSFSRGTSINTLQVSRMATKIVVVIMGFLVMGKSRMCVSKRNLAGFQNFWETKFGRGELCIRIRIGCTPVDVWAFLGSCKKIVIKENKKKHSRKVIIFAVGRLF